MASVADEEGRRRTERGQRKEPKRRADWERETRGSVRMERGETKITDGCLGGATASLLLTHKFRGRFITRNSVGSKKKRAMQRERSACMTLHFSRCDGAKSLSSRPAPVRGNDSLQLCTAPASVSMILLVHGMHSPLVGARRCTSRASIWTILPSYSDAGGRKWVSCRVRTHPSARCEGESPSPISPANHGSPCSWPHDARSITKSRPAHGDPFMSS